MEKMNHLNDYMAVNMLINSPKPEKGESWPGYLLRLSEANQIQGINGIARVLNTTIEKLIISDPKQTMDQLGISIPQVAQPVVAYKERKQIYLASRGSAIRSKVCSKCIRESSQVRISANWDRIFQTYCLSHRIFLLENCPCCSEPISYKRKKVDTCDCGYQFRNAPAQAIDLDLDGFSLACSLKAKYLIDARTFEMSDDVDMNCLVFCKKILALLHSNTDSLRHTKLIGDGCISLNELREVNLYFQNWPDNFTKFAENFVYSKNLTTHFLLRKNNKDDADSLPNIRLALKKYNTEKRKFHRPKSLTKTLKKDKYEQYSGIKDLILSAGISYDVAKFWIKKGWLGDVGIEQKEDGRLYYKICKQRIQKAIYICKSTSSTQNMSQSIGMHDQALRYLVKVKVLTSIQYGHANWNYRVHPSEVFNLAQKIVDVAILRNEFETRRLKLDEAMVRLGRCVPQLLKPFVEDVCSGSLKISKDTLASVEMNQITILYHDYLRWRGLAVEQYANS
jgi:hypothetical protein